MEIVSPEQRPNVSELVKCILNMASSLKALIIIPNCQKPRLLYYVQKLLLLWVIMSQAQGTLNLKDTLETIKC